MCRSILVVLAAAASLSLSACASGVGAFLTGPSPGEDAFSPRAATLQAAARVEPAMKELTTLISAGVFDGDVAEAIAEHGPAVRTLLSGYFDAAEACVVIDGALTTDPNAGRLCQASTLRAIFDAVDDDIWLWALTVGVDTDLGKTIAGARLAIALAAPPREASAAGYRTDAEVPLDQFQGARARLRSVFDTMLATAAARDGARAPG